LALRFEASEALRDRSYILRADGPIIEVLIWPSIKMMRYSQMVQGSNLGDVTFFSHKKHVISMGPNFLPFVLIPFM
jgi:hypothetical protein